MKTSYLKTPWPVAVAALSTSLLFASPLSAIPQDQNSARDRRAAPPDEQTTREKKARHLSAQYLIGKDVHDSTGQKLGNLRDFVIDTQSGRVLYGVVGAGGVLGVGEKLHPVPFAAIQCSEGSKDLSLKVDKAQWEKSPTFQRDQLAALDQAERRKEIHDYYGQSWEALESRVSTALHRAAATISGDPQSTRRLVFASWLDGKNVHHGDNNIGEVEDILINAGGQAVVLFDPTRNFAGSDDQFVIPFGKLVIDAGERERLTTTLSRADFERAEALDESDVASSNEVVRWTRTEDSPGAPDQAITFQRERDRPKILSEEGVVANENRGRDRLPAVTEDRAKRPADADADRAAVNPNAPISQVRYALRSDESLGSAARHIDVSEENGKLVLRGTVPTEDLKNRIEERAEKAAEGWKVENQIAVTGHK